MRRLSAAAYRPLLRAALREDLGAGGDVTTRFFVPARARLKARVCPSNRLIPRSAFRARYYWLLLTESQLTRRLCGAMVQRI